jgi:peptide/nickel transport system substrate-binding protein
MLKYPPKQIVKAMIAAVSIGIASAMPAYSDDVLRLRLQGDIRQFDPVWTTNYTVRNAAYMVWDTLFAADENFEIQPQMVDTWSVSEDGLSYTMTLREGLLWHDGAPVTAADCIASIERWGARDTLGKLMMSKVSGFEALDDRTFEIRLSEPWGHVLTALGKTSSTVPFMMPERLALTDPNEAITEYIGSGPFRLVAEEWIPGSVMVFEKFEDYVPRSEPASGAAGGKIAMVDRIEAHYIPDAITAVNAMIAGEIDWIESVPIDMLEIIEASEEAETYVYDTVGGSAQVVLNHIQPPFGDIRIRQAIQLAVEQSEMHQANMGDRDELYDGCGAVFTCGTPLEFDVLADQVMHKDVEAARQLLAESDYGGEPIVLMNATDLKGNSDFSYVLAEQLKDVGFTVDMQLTDWASVSSRRASMASIEDGGWHLFITGWSGADLMNPLTNVFVTGACEDAWFGWPCSEDLQQTIAAYAASDDPAEQRELAEELQRLAWEEVTFVPIGKLAVLGGRRTDTTGWLEAPVPFFWNVEKLDN